jgi:hypothetical protein
MSEQLFVNRLTSAFQLRSYFRGKAQASLSMWINNKPITTTGISQQTTGIKIQGKKEAA